MNRVHFEKMGSSATVSADIKDVNGTDPLPGAGNRFGYRGPMRPMSTDITLAARTHQDSNSCNGGAVGRVYSSNCNISH